MSIVGTDAFLAAINGDGDFQEMDRYGQIADMMYSLLNADNTVFSQLNAARAASEAWNSALQEAVKASGGSSGGCPGFSGCSLCGQSNPSITNQSWPTWNQVQILPLN